VLALVAMAIVYKMYLSKKTDHLKLTKNNRMKDTLLRIIAHDLKTPFTVIFGYTDVLREDFKSISDEEKLSYIDSIRKASKLSVQLLENLTMWAKSYADKLELNQPK
jgi:K+-sensing histidine kinase KdpD